MKPAPSLISILEIHNVSSGACRLLFGLLSFRNRATGQCNPKIATLCHRLGGVSRRTATRWMAELRAAGILEVKRHRSASEYDFHICGNVPVESVENGARGARNGASRCAKSGSSRCAKNGTSGAPYPYMNQNLFEQTEGNRAADVKLEAIREPVQTAAAAPPPVSHKTPERPAAPVEQLDLNLQATDPIRKQAAALVEELHSEHPQPGLPDKAVGEVQRILAAAEDIEATVELIRANHAAWKAHWEMLRPGAFIPQLWRWFRDGEWKRAVRKPVRHENFYERAERERQEYGEYKWTEKELKEFEEQAEREQRDEERREAWRQWEKEHGKKKFA